MGSQRIWTIGRLIGHLSKVDPLLPPTTIGLDPAREEEDPSGNQGPGFFPGLTQRVPQCLLTLVEDETSGVFLGVRVGLWGERTKCVYV